MSTGNPEQLEPEDDEDGEIDPAVLLMMQLRQDHRMANVPMRVDWPDGSSLEINPLP